MQYIKDTINELKKVVWPTKNEMMKNMIIVVSVSAFVGLLFYGISTGTIFIFKEAFESAN